MKKLITLFLLITSFNSTAYANNIDCSSSGLYFLPKKTEISINSMFIIEGYSFSQKTINNFKHRKVYLEDKNNQKIELVLQETLKDQMYLTQVIFKPEKKLKLLIF